MYKSLQAGRAIAAMLVVLLHLGGAVANAKYFGIAAFAIPFSFGGAGVEFFFVLSGFIILNAHKNDLFQPHKLPVFIKKRCVRIFPTYWIIFIAIFSLALVSSAFRNSVPHDVMILCKAFFLFPQDGNGLGGTGAPVVAVAWTLQYEMFFYFCFCFLILNRLLSTILIITLLYIYISYHGNPLVAFPLRFLSQDYLLLFVMGMAVSAICSFESWRPKSPIVWVFMGGLVFLIVAADTVFDSKFLQNWNTILYGVASSIIIFGLVQAEDRGLVIGGQGWLQRLGNASFSLYLIHNPLISVLCKVFLSISVFRFGVIGPMFSYIAIFIICLVSAHIFYVWIEKPIAIFLKNYPGPPRLVQQQS